MHAAFGASELRGRFSIFNTRLRWPEYACLRLRFWGPLEMLFTEIGDGSVLP
jgi:hypothetical protein